MEAPRHPEPIEPTLPPTTSSDSLTLRHISGARFLAPQDDIEPAATLSINHGAAHIGEATLAAADSEGATGSTESSGRQDHPADYWLDETLAGPPPDRSGSGNEPPVPPENTPGAAEPADDDDPLRPPPSVRDIDNLVESFSRGRPEYQTAVDMSQEERGGFYDDINNLTEEQGTLNEAFGTGVTYRSWTVPQDVLDRHGIRYSIEITTKEIAAASIEETNARDAALDGIVDFDSLRAEAGDPMPATEPEEGSTTQEILAYRTIRGNILEEKFAFFTRQSENADIEVVQDVSLTPTERLDDRKIPQGSSRPLTISELRAIRNALREILGNS